MWLGKILLLLISYMFAAVCRHRPGSQLYLPTEISILSSFLIAMGKLLLLGSV